MLQSYFSIDDRLLIYHHLVASSDLMMGFAHCHLYAAKAAWRYQLILTAL